MRSVVLPYEWSKANVPAILARVRNIYVLTLEGYELVTAAEIAAGKVIRKQNNSWSDAKERFRIQKIEHGAAIKKITWDQKYEPVVKRHPELVLRRHEIWPTLWGLNPGLLTP
jgi:hypothetical protein